LGVRIGEGGGKDGEGEEMGIFFYFSEMRVWIVWETLLGVWCWEMVRRASREGGKERSRERGKGGKGS